MLSLANFSSSGRGEGKKVSARPRTAVQQTRKNEFPAGKQQNFPKSTFATSSWPPPFRPHLVCSSIQRRPWLPTPDKPPHERHSSPPPGVTPPPPTAASGTRVGRVGGKGHSGAATAVSPLPERTGGLTGAAHGPRNSPCLQPRPPRCLLHTHTHTHNTQRTHRASESCSP